MGIRDTKLSQRREPTLAEGVLLCAFIAAAHARTPAQRDHLGGEFTKLREMMEDMIEWAKTATPEQKHGASAVARGAGPSLGYEDVKQLAEKTMETMLVPQIEEMTPLLTALDFAVLEAATEASFITSDDPCVWFDPEGYKRPPLYQGPGLICGSVEITLPVSPRQMILLNQKGRSGYFAAPTRVVDDLNRRTRAHCSEYFVSNSSSTKPIWFDPGAEPNDSWRKRHTAELDDQE